MAAITIAQARHGYARTDGKAWEPQDPNHPHVLALIAGGWVRRTDGRVGFELLKDAMLTWTASAHYALFPNFTTPSPSFTGQTKDEA